MRASPWAIVLDSTRQRALSGEARRSFCRLRQPCGCKRHLSPRDGLVWTTAIAPPPRGSCAWITRRRLHDGLIRSKRSTRAGGARGWSAGHHARSLTDPAPETACPDSRREARRCKGMGGRAETEHSVSSRCTQIGDQSSHRRPRHWFVVIQPCAESAVLGGIAGSCGTRCALAGSQDDAVKPVPAEKAFGTRRVSSCSLACLVGCTHLARDC